MDGLQCEGITVKDISCLKASYKGSDFCNVHQVQGLARGGRASSSSSYRRRRPTAVASPLPQTAVTPPPPPPRAATNPSRHLQRSVRCNDTTADGRACHRTTQATSGYCFEHQPPPSSPLRQPAYHLEHLQRRSSVSFSNPPSSSPSASSALSTFSIEQLLREIMRRIPEDVRSANATGVVRSDTSMTSAGRVGNGWPA